MFKTDSFIMQPDDNIYIIIQPDNTKCEGKVIPSHMITSMLTSSPMITPNVQAYAIIQPDDNATVMIRLGDNIPIVI
jgi:hypothetical protein